MTIKHSFTTALNGLQTHRSRSMLTILGIVIGITAIILVMSLGQGAQGLILKQIQGLGSKTVAVLPGREPKGPTDVAQIFSDSLKETDLEALSKKNNVPTASSIMPVVFGGDSAAYGSETYRLTIFGATDLITKLFDIYPEEGIFFSNEDVKSYANVAVIGAKVKEELFGASDPIGQKIRIKNTNLRVIGVLPKKGQVSFFNFDEMVLLPYTTAQQYIFGIKYFHRIIIEADSDQNIDETVRNVELTLRETHNITDPSKDDFFVQTQANLADSLKTITGALTLFLVAVAGISLLVGGVGIMNIMLVAVTERTREIGLRKAIGAKNKDILTQFLLEAIILTLVGGVIGILLGSALSFIASVVINVVVGLNFAFSFPVTAALLGLGVSAVIGLVFGLYPARQASQKSPIEALRYE